MTERLTYDEVSDLLHGYVLGILEPEEMVAVDNYVQQHQELLAEISRLDSTVNHLALSVPQRGLPSHAKRDLMARVWDDLDDEERLQAQGASASAMPLSDTLPTASETNQSADLSSSTDTASTPNIPTAVVPPQDILRSQPAARPYVMPRPRRGVPYWVATVGSLVAVALLAIVGGAYLNVMRESSALRTLVETQATEIGTLNQQVETLEQQRQSEQAQLAVLSNPERFVDLAGTEDAPDVEGEFYQSGDLGILFVRGLDTLPTESTYQLWLIPADGAPISAGLVDSNGTAFSHLVEIPPGVESYAAVGISIEPAGGSPAPTGPIVAAGEL